MSINIELIDKKYYNEKLCDYNIKFKIYNMTIILNGASLMTEPVCNQFLDAIKHNKNISVEYRESNCISSSVSYEKDLGTVSLYGNSVFTTLTAEMGKSFFNIIINLIKQSSPADT